MFFSIAWFFFAFSPRVNSFYTVKDGHIIFIPQVCEYICWMMDACFFDLFNRFARLLCIMASLTSFTLVVKQYEWVCVYKPVCCGLTSCNVHFSFSKSLFVLYYQTRFHIQNIPLQVVYTIYQTSDIAVHIHVVSFLLREFNGLLHNYYLIVFSHIEVKTL